MDSFCGLDNWLVKNVKSLQYTQPTKIQTTTIPHIINDKGDFIGISKTGTGKTAAFCLPILNELAKDPTSVFAIILEPTRELALQVVEKLQIFTAGFNLRMSLIIGGDDIIKQLLDLDKSPHIIVSTPGRLADLVLHDKISLLENVKYLVLDEFDQLFNDTMAPKVQLISSKITSKDRTNLLFSATYDENKLPLKTISSYINKNDEKFNLYYSDDSNNLNIDVEKTIEKLNQVYLTVPSTLKELYLTHLLKTECKNKSVMIFVQTCRNCQFLYEILNLFSFKVATIHSKMSQKFRFSDLNKFKSNTAKILVATDLACRGLDIPKVDYVINFDLPRNPVDYIHRVGRTARAGLYGKSISFVTPTDVDLILSIEKFTNKKLTELEFNEDEAMKNLSTIAKGKKMIQIKLNDNKKLENISSNKFNSKKLKN